MAFERISLNIIPDGEMPVFHASQFDAGRPIIIDLYNGDDAYTPAAGVTFELHCRKVDDNIVTLDTYEVDGNTITFASTEQLCACSGDNLCEVAIMLDDLLMGTLNFILHVERDPLAGGLTSETSIYNLTQQIDDIISGEGYVKDTDLDILQSDWEETDPTSPAYIKNKPGQALADQADWTETDPLAQSYIKHKPDLKAVATSGSYTDLTDKPTIPTKTSELTNDSGFVESSDLATVATSGDYDDLLNKPTIPAAQVQSDWNQTNTSAVDFIKNKPDLTLVKSATGNPCTFDTDLADNLVSLTAEIVASGGGGTPSTPIPIVGYSSANITRCGVNLWDEEYEDGYIDGSGAEDAYTYAIRSKNYNVVAPNTAYKIIVPSGESGFGICWYDASKTFISRVMNTSSVTSPSNAHYFRLSLYNYKQNYPTYANNVGLNYPQTGTTYHPYTGNTYTIAFGQTVYGGVYDVTRGKLTVTWLGVTYDGSSDENWSLHGSGSASAFAMRSAIAINNINIDAIPRANYLEGISRTVTWGNYDNWVSVTVDKQIVTGIQSITDVDVWKTYLSNNPLQVIYELTTPFDIDLTPVQISALVGTNNITSDLGGDVEVRYTSGELAGQIIDICKMVIAEQGE